MPMLAFLPWLRIKEPVTEGPFQLFPQGVGDVPPAGVVSMVTPETMAKVLGQYRDSAAELHLASVLIKRRDAIGRAYLTAINPIVEPRLDASGTLVFENAATAAGVAAPPAGYRAAWSRFDNATGNTTPLGESRGTTTTLAAPRALPDAFDAFIEVDIVGEGAAEPSWAEPVRTFFRRTRDGWKLVGLERLPETTTARPNGEGR